MCVCRVDGVQFDKPEVGRQVSTPLGYSDNSDPSHTRLGRDPERHLRGLGEKTNGETREKEEEGKKMAGSIKQTRHSSLLQEMRGDKRHERERPGGDAHSLQGEGRKGEERGRATRSGNAHVEQRRKASRAAFKGNQTWTEAFILGMLVVVCGSFRIS